MSSLTNDYIYKTPQKEHGKSPYERTISTDITLRKTVEKGDLYTKTMKFEKYRCPVYNSEHRQYPNIYPNVYTEHKNQAFYRDFQKTEEKIYRKYENFDDFEEFLITGLKDIIENDREIEEIRKKLAYQPDFLIEKLFEMIKMGKYSDMRENMRDFYINTLNYNAEIEEIEGFFRKYTFEEFQRFFDPLDAKYRRFYVGKTDTFPDYCIDFEKLFVFKTQTLIKSLMVRKIENERKNIEIIENSLKIAGENQTKNQTKNKKVNLSEIDYRLIADRVNKSERFELYYKLFLFEKN